MALIRIEDVFVAYGSPSRAVLAGIDLEIEEGSFVCLLGQTGCGKSTLLRLVLGSERPMRGRILIDGSEHPQPDRSRGYVPQKYSLFPDKTVLDNITFGPEVSEFSLLRPPDSGILPAPPRTARPGVRLSAADRPARMRRVQIPAPTLRRHAAACGDRPGADDAPANPVDG